MLITFPVKPYTRKFLLRHLGPDYKLSKVDIYGRYLYQLLRRPQADARYDAFLAQYTKKFALTIDPSRIFGHGMREVAHRLSSCQVNDFNQWVESIFFHEFQTRVQVQVEMGKRRYQAIQEFCDLHGLSEDDISRETLETNYKRFLKKESEKNRKKLIVPSPLNLAA